MKEQNIFSEPCPINSKDLCGYCLFEDIFDKGNFVTHPSDDSVAIGFIAGVPSRARYTFGGNKIWVRVYPVMHNAKSELVNKRLMDVTDTFNEEEQENQRIATIEQESNTQYRITYNYLYNNEDNI